MSNNGDRKGPIAFRMDQEPYTKFLDYVAEQDVGKGKIAERAVVEYLSENEPPTITNRLITAVALAIAMSFPAVLVSIDRPLLAAVYIAMVVLYALAEPQIKQVAEQLWNPLSQLR